MFPNASLLIHEFTSTQKLRADSLQIQNHVPLPIARTLVQRLQNGNEAAYAELVRLYGLLTEETRDLVRACLKQLPARYRKVIQLRGLEEFDTATTAQFLDVSENVVKTRLHRARQALRALLKAANIEA